MDLLIEKGDKRTYLSRYKVITTSFEESSPSVKRNNTQIQYRNGNVDFGGWNEAKTIDYVGYYRADDLEDEEYLREKIYALLSDPEGYYITQLKNDNGNSFERPGETSGDYFDKQINRPSHKRFYVYASSLESELVGSYGDHVLYKISATFTTMKLPYGESVPRDLEVNPNVPYYGRNLLTGTSVELQTKQFTNSWNSGPQATNGYYKIKLVKGQTYTYRVWIDNTNGPSYAFVSVRFTPIGGDNYNLGNGTHINQGEHGYSTVSVTPSADGYVWLTPFSYSSQQTFSAIWKEEKLETGNPTPWSPAPEDSGYNSWYTRTYYNTDNLVIPYAGTVPCSQLEQGFVVEFTAKVGGSGLKIDLNGTDLMYSGQVYSGDVIKLSGYEYTKNNISIVKYTNKAYFKLLPGVTNKISSSVAGTIRILGYQDLYA